MNRPKNTYRSPDTFGPGDDQLANRRLGTHLVYLGVTLLFCMIIVVLLLIVLSKWITISITAGTLVALICSGFLVGLTVTIAGLGAAVPEARTFLLRVLGAG